MQGQRNAQKHQVFLAEIIKEVTVGLFVRIAIIELFLIQNFEKIGSTTICVE